MSQPFKLVYGDLIKLFNQNPRWNATEINLQEAANISVAIAVLKVQNDKFIGDVGDVIRMRINEQADPEDLPNLAKSSFYMRNFNYSKDLYSQVHATAMQKHSQGQLSQEIRDTLTQIYTEQGILTDSPFVEARVQR